MVKAAQNDPLNSSSPKNRPGGQQDQGCGVVLHVQEEVYQTTLTFRWRVARYKEWCSWSTQPIILMCWSYTFQFCPNQGQNTSPWAWHYWTPGLDSDYIILYSLKYVCASLFNTKFTKWGCIWCIYKLDLVFNNVKPNDWYFVLDLVQVRTELGCVRLTNRYYWLDGSSVPLLLLAFFYKNTSCILVGGGGVGWVAHVIIVSAQVLLVLTLGLWTRAWELLTLGISLKLIGNSSQSV